MKRFNTTAVCIPTKHYMVDLSDRVAKIKSLVDDGKYFTINRARQYGKTTTITALKDYLLPDYLVLSLDFQGIDQDVFENGAVFSQAFARLLMDLHEFQHVPIPEETISAFKLINEADEKKIKMDDLFRVIKRWLVKAERPVVLIIDEVDSAANNQVFLDFLSQLRDGYIARDRDGIPAIHSVILAGVTDIRHLKSRLRPEENHRLNSPWNIASDFNLDMSLSETGIRGMLEEYEADHHTGMDTALMANKLRAYTNGYPFLVSRLCQLIDEEVSRTTELSAAWTNEGFDHAMRLLLAEDNSLFESITKNLTNLPRLNASIHSLLMEGTELTWNSQQEDIALMQMYGLIRRERNAVRIDNRVFETMLYNLYLSDEELRNNVFTREGSLARNIFVENEDR